MIRFLAPHHVKNAQRLLNGRRSLGRFLEKLMGAPEVKPLAQRRALFSGWPPLLQACAIPILASLERDRRGRRDHRHRHSVLARALATPKAGQRSGPRGIFRSIKPATRPSLAASIQGRLAWPQVQRPPPKPSYRGHSCSMETAMP